MSLNKTKKEWIVNPDGSQGFLWNPIARIPGISGSRSNSIRKVKSNFHYWTKNILDPSQLIEPYKIRRASRILTCYEADLFSPHNRENWIGEVLFLMAENHRHDFIVVTDFAKSLLKWERFIPENAWLTAKVSGQEQVENVFWLRMVNAKVRFVLFESLRAPIKLNLDNLNWIVFSENSRCNPSSIEYIQPLIDQAKRLKIPIFLTKRLHWQERFQEFPKFKMEDTNEKLRNKR